MKQKEYDDLINTLYPRFLELLALIPSSLLASRFIEIWDIALYIPSYVRRYRQQSALVGLLNQLYYNGRYGD